MKKLVVYGMLGVALMFGMTSTVQAQARGGAMGFIAGCCFGIRSAAAYNDGKEIHWREWIMLVPVVSLVGAIWNGLEGANGVTSSELANRYGSSFY